MVPGNIHTYPMACLWWGGGGDGVGLGVWEEVAGYGCFSGLTDSNYSLPSFFHSFTMYGKVDRRFSSYFEFPKPD